jgi:hypothetical protein
MHVTWQYEGEVNFCMQKEIINFHLQSYEFGTSKVTVFQDVDLKPRVLVDE